MSGVFFVTNFLESEPQRMRGNMTGSHESKKSGSAVEKMNGSYYIKECITGRTLFTRRDSAW